MEKEDGRKAARDGFWDLGSPREKKYEKPDFSAHTVATTEIEEKFDSSLGESTAQSEKIPPRDAQGSTQTVGEKKTLSSSFWIDPIGSARITTSSYRRHGTHKPAKSTQTPPRHRETGRVTSVYDIGGTLIKKAEIRTWETETEFYGRFVSDALQSHRSKCTFPPDAEIRPVPYFSYVPQYAHMTGEQVEYYRYVRENIRRGKVVDCDLPYLQLYIFEIINLAGEIDAETGAMLLARIWLGYRKIYPRLDGYLCEWLPDYCLIHGVKMPDALMPILHEITPKAQFKEFFLDCAMNDGDSDKLGLIVAEAASDYDYRSGRYYKDNAALYDTHIPAVLSQVIRKSVAENHGVFALDRTYKMTRDSYCGAIVASDRKRRIDIEFCSFTRRADTRAAVTAVVKYAENKVRLIAGVRAKLNVTLTDTFFAGMIDGYFASLMPKKARSAEDRYMPEDYLKNYEAEDTGFDFDRAAEIEKRSWANTERLTGEEFSDGCVREDEISPTVDGEMRSDSMYATFVEQSDDARTDDSGQTAGETDCATNVELNGASETKENAGMYSTTNVEQNETSGIKKNAEADRTTNVEYNNTTNVKQSETVPQDKTSEKDGKIASALRAALDGRFGEYCRSVDALEGDIADRVNTLMIDILGDVALEADGGGYGLIEDYREDIEAWLSQIQ